MKKKKIILDDGRYLIYYYMIPKKADSCGLKEQIHADKNSIRLNLFKSVKLKH
jgi:hypothetical protein